MKKMNDPGRPVMKPLAELTLLDRFLFACVMEDRGTMELVLSIILGEEIHLAEQPQAEREMRTVPWLRSIRLDVYSVDEESRVYNAEVQKKNTGNLIKRSRFYQALIDSSLLAPGEIDFTACSPPASLPSCPLTCGDMEGTDTHFGWSVRRKAAFFWKTGRSGYFSIPMELCRRE